MLLVLCGAFLVPAVLSLVLTPWVIRLAGVVGAIDQPNERKAHSQPIPRLGGVAVFVSFFLSLALLLIFDPGSLAPWWFRGTTGVMLTGSLALVLALGV